ncbi:MAG: DUF58 domain-containing protein [Thermoguttaceae bacterium]|jgi:uncharacterized protein (DUF58 family)
MTVSIAPFLREGQEAGARYGLALPRRVPQGTAGAQMGRLAGESMEFMDHREYQPGDDLRRLDWSAYARSDKMIVKLYRQEVCPHLDLVLDGSSSMALEGTAKLRAAVGLAAALATAADNAAYTRRVYVTGAGCRPLPGGTEQPILWQVPPLESAENPAQSLRTLPPAWRPRGIRILISDLVWLGDPLEVLIGIGDRAAAVYVLQVLAAADVEPAAGGNVRLRDSETGQVEETHLDATAAARYRGRLQRHCENWHRAVRQSGGVLVQLVAERLVAGWDFSPLVEAGILTV